MILGEIDNIIIDSSITNPISLDCKSSKCVHHGCCFYRVTLTSVEIAKIEKALPQLNLPPKTREYLEGFNFYKSDNTIRLLSQKSEVWPTCIFFNNGKCLIEDVSPITCRAFPIILTNSILKLDTSNELECLKAGNTPAYILLENEIIMLTSPAFYKKLSELLSTEHKGLFFLNNRK